MPIAACGPCTVSPPTVTMPRYPSRRPPMTLNSVDLPQPEGPITARNSPARTLSETWSRATSGPSGVSNCLMISSTTKIASSARLVAPAAPDFGNVVTLAMKDPQRLFQPAQAEEEKPQPDLRCDTAPASRAPQPG